MEKKEIKAVAKEVTKLLLKQVERDKVSDIQDISLNLSSKQKEVLSDALSSHYKDYKVLRTFKTERTWTNKKGETKTKEFDGVELEKEGNVIKPLFVSENNLLRMWN